MVASTFTVGRTILSAQPDPPQPTFPAGWDFSAPWYHGSPLRLEVLRTGSTITQDATLARAFSHKPTVLCLEDEATPPRIRHNGTLPGLLYGVDEPIDAADIYPHPRSSMPPGLEWLTQRPLRLKLLENVEVAPSEFLGEEELQKLLGRTG